MAALLLSLMAATSALQDPSWNVPPEQRVSYCEGCCKTFRLVGDFRRHLNTSSSCSEIHTGRVDVAQPLQHAPSGDGARKLRESERLAKGLDFCTHLRIKKMVPGAHVQHMKDELRTSVFPMMQRHLQAELSPQWNCTADELAAILARNLSLFSGIESAAREHTQLLNRPGFVRFELNPAHLSDVLLRPSLTCAELGGATATISRYALEGNPWHRWRDEWSTYEDQ